MIALTRRLICFVAVLTVISSSSLKPRISGGDLAESGQFPYIVYFTSASVTETKVLCSGVLINEEWVATIAVCIKLGYLKLDDAVAVAGTSSVNETGTTSALKTLLMHPDYNPYTEEDTVGLVQLSTKFSSSDKIQPIGIGKATEGDTVTLVGWGVRDLQDPTSNELMYLENPVISLDECVRRWADYNTGYYIGDKVFCSYSGLVGEGATEGDVGGAAVVNGSLAGLMYMGLPGQYGVPVVHLKLEIYQDWIEETIKAK